MSQPDDFLAMRRAVADLNGWMHKQRFDPAMAIAVLVSVLSEFAVSNNYKLCTLVENLVLCGADHHDVWAKRVEQDRAAGRL